MVKGIKESDDPTVICSYTGRTANLERWLKTSIAMSITVILALAGSGEGMVAWGAAAKKGANTKLPAAPQGDSQSVSFVIHYEFHVTGTIAHLRCISAIPKTVPGRQTVHQIDFSPQPIAIYDDDDTRYAVFSFGRSSSDLEIKITGEIELYRYDLESAVATRTAAGTAPPVILSDEEKSLYLRPEQFLEVNHPLVQVIARTIKGPSERLAGNTSTQQPRALSIAEVETVQEILDWMKQHLAYDVHQDKLNGAASTISLGKGACQELSDVFVTLCRAKGLHAKGIKGLTAYFETDPTHAWAEVFLSDLGWVPFEPTWWMTSAFAKLRPLYIRETSMRSDSRLNIRAGAFLFWFWWEKNKGNADLTHSYHFYPR